MFLFGQSQSRLNVGKDPKRVLSTSNDVGVFGRTKMPEKLNFDSKTELTKFYRDILLNNKSAKVTESTESKAVAKPTEAVVLEKIKLGNIYPNPAITYAEIPYEVLEDFKVGHATVMNMVGLSLLEYNLSAVNNKLRINTTSLESGIYLVQFVVDGKKLATKKLLVERN